MKMLNTNQVVFEDVTAKYPRLNQTYKFDTVENKTTPCSPLDDGAAYTLDFETVSYTHLTLPTILLV